MMATVAAVWMDAAAAQDAADPPGASAPNGEEPPPPDAADDAPETGEAPDDPADGSAEGSDEGSDDETAAGETKADEPEAAVPAQDAASAAEAPPPDEASPGDAAPDQPDAAAPPGPGAGAPQEVEVVLEVPGAGAPAPPAPASSDEAPSTADPAPDDAEAAAEADGEDELGGEVIVITGTRAVVQTSLEEKRYSDTIVDALSADDIGDIPALSIGEALETLPGAASHREQGGATEISIRGMGPYLSSTVINGREATNGSGDRSVNFSQFPSELFAKLKVYKSQEAQMIEGGVSGQISLETLKPLEYGKRRFQVDAKGNYHPDNGNITDNARDFGYRLTLSYIDQFDADELGQMGVSIGYQKRRTTNPEQEFRTTSAWRDCRNDPSTTDGGVGRSDAGNCDDGAGDLDLEVDPETGRAPDDGVPFIFAPSSRSFRQNITDDDRESAFAAFQWRPFDDLDINFDVQLSDRTFSEVRNDLVFAEQRRIVPGVTDGTLESLPTGEVARFDTIGRIETNSAFQERIESYRGGGLNLSFAPTETLRLSVDGSYSSTKRRENIWQTRLQTGETDIFGNPTEDRIFTSMSIPGAGSQVPLATVRNFDVTNADLFSSNARTRIDLNQLRENTISAIRGDAQYTARWGPIVYLLGGVRYSSLEFRSFPRTRAEFDGFEADAVGRANLLCRNKSFPESGFLSGPSGGQDLITNIDDAGNPVAAGTGSAYATFDARCLVEELLGLFPETPGAAPSVQNIDVEERTLAGYLQANYFARVLGLPVHGNVGVRIVNTDVNSVGLRTTFTTTRNQDGTLQVEEDSENLEPVVGGSDYTEFLPSLNVVVDARDDLLVRGAVFRGLSRPDPADLGFGRVLDIDDSGDPTSVEDFVTDVVTLGNPDLRPLTSWNLDAAVEWYPNADTILAGGAYYKRFLGGFENAQRVETFEIDGQPLESNVTVLQTDDQATNLFGLELSAAHVFAYLPAPLDGLGARINVNVAQSDFEFEDQNFGASRVFDEEGERDRVGIVPPANLFGFSRLVLSGQLYYQIAGFDLQLILKHRSSYFQQFISTPGNIRYIATNTVFEGRATYRLTKNFALRFEAINLLDEPRVQFNPTPDNLAEVNSYGPRLFLSLRAKL